MLGKYMKNSKQMVTALCLAFVIVSTAAIGAWAVSNIFSNHEQQTVTGPESAIIIDTLTALPDLPAKGVAYDLTFSVDFTVTASDAYAVLVITAPGITESDVSVTYPDGGLGMVTTGTDSLTFAYGIPPQDGQVTLQVTFNAAGTYATDLVVEATA